MLAPTVGVDFFAAPVQSSPLSPVVVGAPRAGIPPLEARAEITPLGETQLRGPPVVVVAVRFAFLGAAVAAAVWVG
jgi:hypothetical protein